MTTIYEKAKKLPDTFGVYLLKDAQDAVIYVGKSNSIRKRIYSHLRGRLIEKIHDIQYIETASELTALILEAKLIKQFMPRYNVMLRDDKQYPYIKLTLGEGFPRLLIVRKVKADGAKYFGPFRSGSVREILKAAGRLFPLRRCKKTEFKTRTQTCLNYHMKKCSGPCAGKISRPKYAELVKNVQEFFDSGVEKTIEKLTRQMDAFSKKQNFEKAAEIRDKIQWLSYAGEKKSFLTKAKGDTSAGLEELSRVLGMTSIPHRMEAFDISNLGSSQAVGAMVAFEDGLPLKTHYRKFIIQSQDMPNDVAAIFETVRRRFGGTLKDKLPLPDLLIIDGGKGQVNSAYAALIELGIRNIKLIGLAKKNEEIFFPNVTSPVLLGHDSPALHILQNIRDEAHRYVISFHRKRRAKAFIPAEKDS